MLNKTWTRRSLSALALPALLVALAPSCEATNEEAGAGGSAGKGDGARHELALTPPMGFNNWNAFGCDVNEALIKETADFFVASGLKEVGYEFVNIDDCWALRDRDPDGRLVPDPGKFPTGIKGLADYVHGLGLKLGIYGDAGTQTCAGYPGSLGYEELDAQTWADWGVDYLKYDNCHNQSDGSRDDYVQRYTAMRDALQSTGRPIVYSICEWGTSQPWTWATDVGQLWRTTGDISDTWSSLRSIIATNVALASYAGPGHWNDPDMLEIGNGGMTELEYRTHMSMWAMMAAPLLIGTDLRVASAETLALLTNRELIAIDQDPLGKQGSVVASRGSTMVLDKPLASGEHAIALYNSSDDLARVAVSATAAGLPDSGAYRLVDVWSGITLKSGPEIAAGVPPHGTVVYRVSPVATDEALPPPLALAATLDTLLVGFTEGAIMTASAENVGLDAAKDVSIVVSVPTDWIVTAIGPSSIDSLSPGHSFETTFNVYVPTGTAPGRYSLGLTAVYDADGVDGAVTVTSELAVSAVGPPPDGTTHLSALVPSSSENGLGPLELDLSNGESAQADGNLLTLDGRIYTRGLGTHSPSELVYYLGGRCSTVTTDVGIDDEVSGNGSVTFIIYADDEVVAESAELTAADAAETLSADVTGATWLRLVVEPGGATTGDHADWAMPLLVCGDSTEPSAPELTLFSFEAGDEDWTVANSSGGALASTDAFHTEGDRGLEVVAPTDGNWFGRSLTTPLDLTAFSTLKVDLQTSAEGTSGEFALQVGASSAWCQGSLWTWTNPKRTGTIKRSLNEIACPSGTTLDLSDVRGIWVFLKAGTFQIDNVRAE